MKTAIHRKPFQAKLSHLISAYVKSVTDADSKKISKSIKKASKSIAKTILKEIKENKTLNPFWEKSSAKKRKVAKTTKAKVVKKSPPKVAHKTKKAVPAKAVPVKVVQKIEEIHAATSSPEVKVTQEVV